MFALDWSHIVEYGWRDDGHLGWKIECENARDLECAGRCVAVRAAMDGLRFRESVRGRSARESVKDIRMSFSFFPFLFFLFPELRCWW